METARVSWIKQGNIQTLVTDAQQIDHVSGFTRERQSPEHRTATVQISTLCATGLFDPVQGQ